MTETTTTTTIETPAATLAPATHAHANGKPVGTKKAKLAAHKAKKAGKKAEAAATKPATTKGSKPKATVVTANKEVKPAGAGGLTGTQIAILKALADGPEGRTKLETLGASSKILGAVTRDGLGAQGGGMIGAGLIRACEPQAEGGGRLWYQITAAGTKALAKAAAAK